MANNSTDLGLEDLIKEIARLVGKSRVVAVLDYIWGDGGKGKVSDAIATYWGDDGSDVNARGSGGNNAGHTTIINGLERIFHLIPAGIVHDKRGKFSVMGNGMVIDMDVLCQELDELDRGGLTYNNLMISEDAFVTLPFHITLDKGTTASQKSRGVGSTGRGIGPAYADKIGSRAGIQVRDLFDKDVVARRLKKLEEYHFPKDIQRDATIAYIEKFSDRIKPFVRDTVTEMHNFYKQGKRILLEGAQGTLLSSECGTYPHQTASDCSLNGTATGVGFSAKVVDLPLGIVTFPIMHRVGGGAFPSELGEQASEDYCAATDPDGKPTHAIKTELREHGIPFEEIDGKIRYDFHHPEILKLMNSRDPMTQGIGLRFASKNYGATTGRPRRMGWLDLKAIEYSISVNDPIGCNLVLTKPNCIRGAEEFKLGVGYEGGGSFSRGETYLRNAKPVYQTFEGSDVDITGMTDVNDLPSGLREGMGVLEKVTGGKIRMISAGADRSQNIVL